MKETRTQDTHPSNNVVTVILINLACVKYIVREYVESYSAMCIRQGKNAFHVGASYTSVASHNLLQLHTQCMYYHETSVDQEIIWHWNHFFDVLNLELL